MVHDASGEQLVDSKPSTRGKGRSRRRGTLLALSGLALVTLLYTGKAMTDPDMLNCLTTRTQVELGDTTADLANRKNPGGLTDEELAKVGDFLLRQENPLQVGTWIQVPLVDKCPNPDPNPDK